MRKYAKASNYFLVLFAFVCFLSLSAASQFVDDVYTLASTETDMVNAGGASTDDLTLGPNFVRNLKADSQLIFNSATICNL